MVTVSIDLDALALAFATSEAELREDLQRAGVDAAQGGVDAAKAHHPYTDRTHDLTETSHVEPIHDAKGGALMVWPQEYAGFVDEGTSRARPYPFTPLAEQVAERDLEHLATEAVQKFKRSLER